MLYDDSNEIGQAASEPSVENIPEDTRKSATDASRAVSVPIAIVLAVVASLILAGYKTGEWLIVWPVFLGFILATIAVAGMFFYIVWQMLVRGTDSR